MLMMKQLSNKLIQVIVAALLLLLKITKITRKQTVLDSNK